MPELNWIAIIVSAFVPILFGAFWYHPQVSEVLSGQNLRRSKYSLTIYMISVLLPVMTGFFIALLMSAHSAEEQNLTHGAFHGALLAVFVTVPAMTIHFMFEGDRSVRNMIYHIFYWIICTGIMGAIIGAWH